MRNPILIGAGDRVSSPWPRGRSESHAHILYDASLCFSGRLTPSCIIVIPVYTDELSKVECAALRVCASKTQAFSLCFVHKRSIDLEAFLARHRITAVHDQLITGVAVDDCWLESVGSYNLMLLQSWFYRLFDEWTYLLIFQLDAWILKNDLSSWLAKNYTYIGAPWTGHLGPDTPDIGVGNGGLSLRLVREMIEICESPLWRYMPVFRWQKLAYRMTLFRRYHLFPPSQRPLLFFKRLCLFLVMSLGWRNTLEYYARSGVQEDHLLSVYAPCVYGWMRIPPLEEAAAFSIETNPRQTFKVYAIDRPFGCHAWEKHDRDFWLSTFPLDFQEAQ